MQAQGSVTFCHRDSLKDGAVWNGRSNYEAADRTGLYNFSALAPKNCETVLYPLLRSGPSRTVARGRTREPVTCLELPDPTKKPGWTLTLRSLTQGRKLT
jgi:hypothetical protein